MPRTEYSTIVADPPWPFDDKLPGGGRGAVKHYRTLPIHEIQRFPLPPLADDCRLILWRVASMQEEALAVVRAWGFRPVSEIAWVKAPALPLAPVARLQELREWCGLSRREVAVMVLAPSIARGTLPVALDDAVRATSLRIGAIERHQSARGNLPPDDADLARDLDRVLWHEIARRSRDVTRGLGRQVRNAHEVAIVAVRGRPGRLDKGTPSVVFAPRAAHSAKPDEFYELVERFSPGPYVELFGRRLRRGWKVLGDEAPRARKGSTSEA